MVGAGESYLPAYALSVGMSETLSGFFSSVPLITGALIQLLTPWAVGKMGSAKNWVVATVTLQAISFVPLVYFTIYGVPNFLALFLVAIIYWGAGFAAGPVWNYWMEHLVPTNSTASYFAMRTRISQIGILIGLIGGGIALYKQVKIGPFTSVFSTLFLVAFVARATSSFILSLKDYNPNWFYTERSKGLFQIISKFWKNKSYRQFFTFIFLFHMVIYISAAFVSPFFLAKLKMNYFDYMLSLSVLLIAKIIMLQFAPQLIKKFGVKVVFFIGVIGISPLPAFWGLYHEFWFVLILQSISGAFWALFEVAMTLIFFKQIQSYEKIPILTFFNFFNSLALIIGTTIGGQILLWFNESMVGYAVIFVIGSALRMLLALWFERQMRRKKEFLV